MQQHHRTAPRAHLRPEQSPRRQRAQERGAARLDEHGRERGCDGRQASRRTEGHAQRYGGLLGREAGWHVDVQVRWRRGQGHGRCHHADVDRCPADGDRLKGGGLKKEENYRFNEHGIVWRLERADRCEYSSEHTLHEHQRKTPKGVKARATDDLYNHRQDGAQV